ncbi:MAG: oligosaccharide flippase family protein, partial [Candidatus Hydrogenedentales bacterium]
LIGFFATLLATLNLLDMGLSSTLNRQLARCSASSGTSQEQHDLVRTLECIYWLTALVVGTVILLTAPYIARYWVNAQNLTSRTVSTAISLMGLIFVFQFPFGLYQGGLMGLQRHVTVNGILGAMAVLRSLGAVGVLLWFSPTISAYFLWQFLCSGVQVILIRACLWKALPPAPDRPRFRVPTLAPIWRFAAGMTGIALVSIVLSNMDRVLLSKMLPLREFGYYMAAATLSSGILTLAMPFFMAAFPRFSQMMAGGCQKELKQLYHALCQTVSCAVLPCVAVLAFFSPNVVFVWSNNKDLVEHSSAIVGLLVVGTGINAVLNIPYALQLADGWTKFAFYQNVISVVLLLPLLVILIRHFGAVGAAMNWVILHIGYILISPHVMHSRLLPTEKWRWYFGDLLIPASGIVAAVWVARILLPLDNYGRLVQLVALGGIWGAAVLSGAALCPEVRRLAQAQWRKVRGVGRPERSET